MRADPPTRPSTPQSATWRLAWCLAALLCACGGDHPQAAQASAAPGLAGRFEARSHGVDSRLELELRGDELAGTLSTGGVTLDVRGTWDGARASGQIVGVGGLAWPFELAPTDAGLALTLSVSDPTTGLGRGETIAYRRTPAAPGASGGAPDGDSHPPALVGTWTRSESLGGGPDGFTGVVRETMRLLADGGFVLGAGEFHGGGPGSSGSARGGPDQARGRWRAQGAILYVRGEDAPADVPLARYHLEGHKLLLTFADGSRQLWLRG